MILNAEQAETKAMLSLLNNVYERINLYATRGLFECDYEMPRMMMAPVANDLASLGYKCSWKIQEHKKNQTLKIHW